MRAIPQLDTPRLRLRAHCAADHRAAHAIWSHSSVYKFITGSPLSEQDVWLRLLRYSGLWDFLGYGYWAVEDRSSGRYIGQMGFANFKRGLIGFEGHFPEAGWVLHPDFAGRGIATEGMQAACAWLDEHGSHARSFCIVAPQNLASIRVAQKVGYAYVLETQMGGEPTAVYFRDTLSDTAVK